TANSTINGTSGSVTVSAAAASQFAVTAPSSATAGSAFSITITALDAFNNTATAYNGTVRFSSSDSAAALPNNSALTSGVGSFSVTLKTASPYTTPSPSTATSTINGTSNSVTVSAAAASQFLLSAPGSATAGSA